ncbi:hypothetical protein HFO84_07205 [Rhizobium leguminosarum]|uniref:hypothetical protein n=1 Tax=Rhizobium leguminosarum TaxID=384 RepID=UPI001C937897|nr:hypothetical protein [Rhizobium leguminosarum]MBY5477119.1 hypothetical protein [Rhizobium leguminosarum]
MEVGNILNSLLTHLARIVRATIPVSFMIAALSGAVVWWQNPPIVVTALGAKIDVAAVLFQAATGFFFSAVALEIIGIAWRSLKLSLRPAYARLKAKADDVAVADQDRVLCQWDRGSELLWDKLWDSDFEGSFIVDLDEILARDSVAKRHLRFFEAEGFITMTPLPDEGDDVWEVALEPKLFRRRLLLSMMPADSEDWNALQNIRLSATDRFKLATLRGLLGGEPLSVK